MERDIVNEARYIWKENNSDVGVYRAKTMVHVSARFWDVLLNGMRWKEFYDDMNDNAQKRRGKGLHR